MKAINLIPLAGKGQRFVDDGYALPKPLLLISGKPMIVQAANSLPKTEQYVFVTRTNHVKEFQLDQTLKKYFPSAIIIQTEELTKGQACSAYLAKDHCDHDAMLTIGACDHGLLYDYRKFNDLISSNKYDALIWTFSRQMTLKLFPQMYGWVAIKNDKALRTSCKQPISSDPFNDQAIVGTFTFKRAEYFFKYVEQMVEQNKTINGEFYIDECMNFLIAAGLNVGIFEVDHYIGWGTPQDLKTFEYWQKFFDVWDGHPYCLRNDIMASGRHPVQGT